MQPKKPKLLFKYSDTGNVRRYYHDINLRWRSDNSVYCMMQDSAGETVMCACSKDGEPSHTINDYEIIYN